MKRPNGYPISVQPGIPKLNRTPIGWHRSRLSQYLKEVRRPITLDDNENYTLVTAKRSRGGIVRRDKKHGAQIKVKTQFSVREGDFLISKRQIVHGACGIVPAELDGAIVSNEYSVLASNDGLLIPFLKYLAESIYFQQTCFHASIGVHVEKMIFKLDRWLNVEFNLPSTEEQQQIVRVLSAWDRSLDVLQRLVRSSEQQKVGLVQLLFDPHQERQSVNCKWQTFRLGELFEERAETNCRNLPLLSITGSQGVVPQDELGRKNIASSDKSRYKRLTPGDIGYNTMRMWQGVSALSNTEGIVSPAYTIVRSLGRIDPLFASYLFKVPRTVHDFRRYSQGLTSDTWNLKFPLFSRVKVQIPPLVEQKEIAQILKKADDATESLRTNLSLLERERTTLIQDLVTGRVRVNALRDKEEVA